MTPIRLYRAVASLGRIEGLSRALRENLIQGHPHGAMDVIASLEKDIQEVREAVERLAVEPLVKVD